MTKKIREDIIALQNKLADGVPAAAREFRKVLESKATANNLFVVQSLRERLIPGSSEEQQLDAYVSVHNSILQYLSQQYPDQVEAEGQEVTPQPAGPAA